MGANARKRRTLPHVASEMQPEMAESERDPFEDGPTWDEARYARATLDFRHSVEDIAEYRLVEDGSNASWRIRRTSWAFDERCRQFEREYALRSELGSDWAVLPCALIRPSDGPVLIYREPFGTTLDELAHGTLPISDLLRMAAGMAEALAKLHGARLVHRDLRPEHFVLSGDGSLRIRSFLSAKSPYEDASAVERLTASTAPYAAPERSGPHASLVDERSDLYSFGVVLFQLLTGAMPFRAGSEAEWVHAHLAIQPARPWQFRADVPGILSELIAKLLAKDAHDRYQTAEGLWQDLIRMQRDWDTSGTLSRFELARAERLVAAVDLIPFIGRQQERKQLADAYSAVLRSSQAALVLIEGSPGSGKTMLATDFRKRLLPLSFWSVGKADQYQPSQPYAPVVQALRSLCLNVIGKGGAAPTERGARLQTYAADDLNLLIRLVPEVELLVGPRDAGADVADGAPAPRIQRALIQAFRSFAALAAPLVLMLDDLQWADDATLGFVEAFAAQRPANILLVAACRARTHQTAAFRDFAERIERAGALEISLAALTPQLVVEMTAALIGEPQARVARLGRIVHRKTGGNPFHVRQLLRALFDERLVRFDAAREQWSWDEAQVEALHTTDDIVHLLSLRLQRQSPPIVEALCWLACASMQGDEALLARASGLPAAELSHRLNGACRAGLVEPGEGGWRFVHDRVLEAAYAAMSADARSARHTAIAVAMIELYGGLGEQIALDIAGQIELAQGATISREQAKAFASVLADAAERAVVAAARDRALEFLSLAAGLIGEDAWANQYELAKRIALLRCESLLAVGRIECAAHEIDALMPRMRSRGDQAHAHRLKAAQLTVASDFAGAVAVALAGLEKLDVYLPARPCSEDLVVACRAVDEALGGRAIADLVHLPRMDDEGIEAAMALLTALEAAMFYPSEGLALLHLAAMVRLTLRHGVTGASVQGLAWYGVYVAQTFGDYAAGLEYAKVALALVDHHGFERYRAATLIALDQVSVWTLPLRWALARAREAKAAGHLSAELRWMCYSCNHIVSDLIAMGEALPKIQEEIEPLLSLTRGAAYHDIVDLVTTQSEFVASLQRDRSQPIGSWQAPPDGSSASAAARPAPMSVLSFWTLVLRGQSAFLFDDVKTAEISFREAALLAWSTPAHIMLSDFRLYSALTLIYAVPDWRSDASATAAIRAHREQFAIWADLNSGTFGNKLAMIDAEFERVAGNDVAAMRLYETSASLAAAAGFVHEQALAHELAGRHAVELGLPGVARHHLGLAHACYRRWGALAKAAQLEAKYAFLAVDDVSASRLYAKGGGRDDLDFMVAMRTAQSLSEEIILERLIQNLMTNMVVHAGARYGLLMLMRDASLRIEATARVENGEIVVDTACSAPTQERIPLSILNTVIHTKKPLVFDDAQREGEIAHAESLGMRPARSVFCLPLLKQGALVGVLYLENALVQGVFTPSKTAMLEVLAPQAANSLEAARLYAELVEENTRRQETEAALRRARTELARNAHVTVLGEMAASIAHEINQPLTSIVSSVGAGVRWLRAADPDMEEALSSLEDIQIAAVRAADIVRSLRSLAKQSPVALAPVAIDDVLREMLELTAMEVESNGVELRADLNAGGLEVLADRTQIQQIVLNLITNALDAMGGMTGARQLDVMSRRDKSTVVVSVSDSGSGIDIDLAERIFEPFFTTKENGMGMGLAICRSIMEAHGGTLSVQPRPLGGTTFVFELPLAFAS